MKRYIYIKFIVFVLISFSCCFKGFSQSTCFWETLFNKMDNDKEFKGIIESNNNNIDAYVYLYENGSKYVQTNTAYFKKFTQLNGEVQKYVAKFTDDKAGATLSKFLDDCEANPEMMQTINQNPILAEGMLGHKNKWTKADYEAIGEEINNLEVTEPTINKLIEWTDRSAKISKFGDVVAMGNGLSKNIKTALASQLQNYDGKFYNDLAELMGYDINDAVSMEKFKNYIKDFELLEEIPLITSGGFMKADILLIKRTPDGIEDAIIIENKLSQNTAFTVRQKEGFGAIIDGQLSMKTKYVTSNLAKDLDIPISKDKIFKFNDAGTDNITNVTVSKITSIK